MKLFIKQVDIDFDTNYPFNVLVVYESGATLNYIIAQIINNEVNIHKAKNVGVDTYPDCESFAFTVIDVVLVAKEVFGGTGMRVILISDRYEEHKFNIDALGLRNVFVYKPKLNVVDRPDQIINIDYQYCSDLINQNSPIAFSNEFYQSISSLFAAIGLKPSSIGTGLELLA